MSDTILIIIALCALCLFIGFNAYESSYYWDKFPVEVTASEKIGYFFTGSCPSVCQNR